MALYDLNPRTTVSTDASSNGLGAVLIQEQVNRYVKPLSYISRSLFPTEEWYAQIEKEALAFTWACKHFSDFLFGLKFSIKTDHKLLIPLFSIKHLPEFHVRVQRFRLQMLKFDFNIVYVQWNNLVIIDALSSVLLMALDQWDKQPKGDVQAYVDVIVQDLPAMEQRLEGIQHAQENGPLCQEVAQYCREGWPEKGQTKCLVKWYSPVSSEILIVDGLLMRNEWLIISSVMQKQVLDQLHTGHQGIGKCREWEKQTIWWPGLLAELENVVCKCWSCCMNQEQKTKPIWYHLLFRNYCDKR